MCSRFQQPVETSSSPASISREVEVLQVGAPGGDRFEPVICDICVGEVEVLEVGVEVLEVGVLEVEVLKVGASGGDRLNPSACHASQQLSRPAGWGGQMAQ